MDNENLALENEILQRAINGDIHAFEQLILKYEKLVFNISYRMMGNVEDAKDISQEALFKIYKNLSKCVDIRHFKSWICMITNNTCIDELRKRKGKTNESLDEYIELQEGGVAKQIRSNELTPEETLSRKERSVTVQEAINRLSYGQKILIVLRDIQGLSYEEMVNATNLSMGTVKSRLARARANLKKILTSQAEQKLL